MSVVLRALVADDWSAVHEWAGREDACRFQAWGPNTPEQSRAFVAASAHAWQSRPQSRFPYAVVLGPRVVGMAELKLHSADHGEISYSVHPEMWSRGMATAAARQLLRVGFVDRGLHRITGTCDPRNVGSGRVLAKIGMTYEGRMRETTMIRDGWRDSDLYSILAHEFRL
jgi:[ribosomal protein S5]-alanine N-acetyltransferase